MNPLKIEISWQTLWRIFFFAIIAYFVFLARQMFGVLFLAMVIALGIDPLVSLLERKKINRLLSTLLIFIIAILLLGTLVYVIAPVVGLELESFLQHFSKTISTLFGISLSDAFLKDLNSTINQTLGFLSVANISVSGAIGTIFHRVLFTISGIIITFYLTVAKDGTERLLRVVLPDAYERSILRVFGSFKGKIRHWLGAQLVLSLVMGVIVWFGLWLLGVQYPLVLGILAGVFELVPVVGPILTGVLAFLVAIPDSVSLGLYAVLFFFIVQQLENHILVPLVMGKAVDVHPVIVIIALLAGGEVAGLTGLILAVPVAVLAQEFLNYLADQKSNRPTLNL